MVAPKTLASSSGRAAMISTRCARSFMADPLSLVLQ
jgi:hypothetical protein